MGRRDFGRRLGRTADEHPGSTVEGATMNRTAAILGSAGMAFAVASFATPAASVFLVWIALLAVAAAALLGSRVLTLATIAVCAASILFVNSLVGLTAWITGSDAAGASVMNRSLLVVTGVLFVFA